MLSETRFTQTLGLIYDAAVASDRWPALLERIGDDLRCHYVSTVRSNRDRSRFDGRAHGIDADEHLDFLRRFHQRGPLRALSPRPSTGDVIDLHDIMPRAEFEKTEMFDAYFRPRRWDEGVRLTIWRGESGTHTISVLRSARPGPLGTRERRYVKAIMPHLQRMALVMEHTREADLMMRSAADALRLVRQPTLLIGEDGRIVFANDAAESLLGAADGLTVRGGRLAATDSNVARHFDAVIGGALRGPRVAATMRLPRAERLPLSLVAMPLEGGDALLSGRGVLVCVSDPALRVTVPEAVLTSLFGLTRAEAALAADLLGGRDVGEIADATERSVCTVRNLLSRLMAKTSTHRQSDLVRMLGSISGIAPAA